MTAQESAEAKALEGAAAEVAAIAKSLGWDVYVANGVWVGTGANATALLWKVPEPGGCRLRYRTRPDATFSLVPREVAKNSGKLVEFMANALERAPSQLAALSEALSELAALDAQRLPRLSQGVVETAAPSTLDAPEAKVPTPASTGTKENTMSTGTLNQSSIDEYAESLSEEDIVAILAAKGIRVELPKSTGGELLAAVIDGGKQAGIGAASRASLRFVLNQFGEDAKPLLESQLAMTILEIAVFGGTLAAFDTDFVQSKVGSPERAAKIRSVLRLGVQEGARHGSEQFLNQIPAFTEGALDKLVELFFGLLSGELSPADAQAAIEQTPPDFADAIVKTAEKTGAKA